MAWFFLILSVAGLVASFVVHLASFRGAAFESAWLLHIGVVAGAFPAILIARPAGSGFGNRVNLRDAFRGAPSWVMGMLYVFFANAAVNIAALGMRGQNHQPAGPMPAPVARGFSAGWMLFYWVAGGMFLAAINRGRDATAPPANDKWNWGG